MKIDFSKIDKAVIVTDNHLCEKSSVISGMGVEFTDRLENQILSLGWVNSLGLPVIHLGDFTNTSSITAQEQVAIDRVKEYTKDWLFLRGNHEYQGRYDVIGAMGSDIIRDPEERVIGGCKCLFLPFNSTEDDIKDNYDIIFGHIGIDGVPFGAKGFNFSRIDSSCKVFLNGHLHNRLKLGDNKWNIGSLTAQNFSDNCLEYRKGVVILDFKTLELKFIENPYAFNFYKFTYKDYINHYKDGEVGKAIRSKDSCISLSCKEGEKQKIIDSREFDLVYYIRISEEGIANRTEVSTVSTNTLDHISKFRESFLSKSGESKLVLEELAEVLK